MTPTEKLIKKLRIKFHSGDENLRVSEQELKLINKNPEAIYLYSKIKMTPYEKGEKKPKQILIAQFEKFPTR